MIKTGEVYGTDENDVLWLYESWINETTNEVTTTKSMVFYG